MQPDLKKLLMRLVFEDVELCKQKKAMIDALGNKRNMQAILDKQSKERGSGNCFSCNEEGACSTIIGAAHFDLGQFKKAILELEDANHHFRGKDETWNLINGMELLGWAYEMDGNRHQALLEYKEALHILTYKHIPLHAQEYKTDGASLKNELTKLLAEPIPNKKNQANLNSLANLSVARMPIYAGVQAGPNGPIWQDPLPEKNYTDLDGVLLENRSHQIHSLIRGNKTITLTRDKQYGWAKVFGDSMSACSLVPIANNDFVLFYEAIDAEENSIVIASRQDVTGAGFQYVVKKLDKNKKMLLSETDPPGLYDPIPLTKNVKILGVAIAVAKPG